MSNYMKYVKYEKIRISRIYVTYVVYVFHVFHVYTNFNPQWVHVRKLRSRSLGFKLHPYLFEYIIQWYNAHN